MDLHRAPAIDNVDIAGNTMAMDAVSDRGRAEAIAVRIIITG
jgi:hypothetical protein